MRPIPLTRPKPSSSIFLLLLASCTAAAFSVLVMFDPMEKRDPKQVSPEQVPSGPPLRIANADAYLAASVSWLLRHQNTDGSWSAGAFARPCAVACAGPGAGDVNCTAIAAMALIEAGADRAPVGKAIDAIMKSPKPHALQVLAVAQAAIAFNDDGYRAAARRMLPSAKEQMGISLVEMAFLAEAAWALKETVNAAEIDRLNKDISQSLDLITKPDGRVSGLTPGADEHETGVAIGLRLRLGIGKDGDAPVLATAVQRIACDMPVASSVDFLYWYEGTQALMLCRQSQAQVWAKWSSRVMRLLVGSQRKEGCLKGSWDVVGTSGEGRVDVTALNAITLARIIRFRSSIAVEQD